MERAGWQLRDKERSAPRVQGGLWQSGFVRARGQLKEQAGCCLLRGRETERRATAAAARLALESKCSMVCNLSTHCVHIHLGQEPCARHPIALSIDAMVRNYDTSSPAGAPLPLPPLRRRRLS